MVPNDLKYTKTHEWVKIENTTAIIGITDFAVTQINEIIYIELPKPGKTVTRNAPFGSIESVKAVFDLFAPVDGSIVEANEFIKTHPEETVKDPYGKGWMIKVELAANQPFDTLLNAEQYTKLIAEEVHH